MTLTEGIKGKSFGLWIGMNRETTANCEMETKKEKLRVKLNFIDSAELYVNCVCVEKRLV